MAEGLIGNYRIGRKLGEGGMGTVYLAEHTLLGRKAALKVLLPALSANPDIVNRFFNEARSATAIADPGIVQIFDFGIHTDGSAFIVMELLEGEPLDQRLHRSGRLAPPDALRIIRQAAVSLQAAHSAGIVHRDLKPENIYLVRDPEAAGGERPKILDFGIAKLGHGGGEDGNRFKTRTGALMGTPVYMSPEQCRGAGDIDHRSDIYALGCVLFHLLVGKPPFDGDGMGEVIAAHLREPPPHPSTMVPGLRPEIEAIVMRCLAKPVGERFQSMGELASAIGAIQQYITASGSNAATPWAATSYITPPHGAPGTYPPAPGTYPGGPGTHPGGSTTTPTTLGTSAGQMQTAVTSPSRRWMYAVVALALAGGATAAVIVTSKSSPQAATTAPVGKDPMGTPVLTIDAGVEVAQPNATIDAGLPIDAAAQAAVAIDASVELAVDAGKPGKPGKPNKPDSHSHRPHHDQTDPQQNDKPSTLEAGEVDRGD